jgi:hypothetical protein
MMKTLLTLSKESLVDGRSQVVEVGKEPIDDPVGELFRGELLHKFGNLNAISMSQIIQLGSYFVRTDSAVSYQSLQILSGIAVVIELDVHTFRHLARAIRQEIRERDYTCRFRYPSKS